MGDVSKAIERYIRDYIKLELPDISRSARSREWLKAKIINKIAQRYREPVLYSPKKFLHFGSYFKGTKVKSVDEFDMLVIIDSNTGVFRTAGNIIGNGQGTADPNYKYEGRKYHKSDDSGVSPTKMLNWLKGIVAEVFETAGGEIPVRNGQAITAYIKSTDTTIDLVPAGIFERVNDGKVFYNIPKGDKDDGWITTAPEDDIEAVKNAAIENPNFKNVVRICKRVNDTYNFKTNVSSFAIETIIVKYSNEYTWDNNLYTDCRWALWYVAKTFREGSIYDPFSGNNLLAGIDTLDWYASRIDKIIETLDNCTKIDDQERVQDLVVRAFENQL